MLLDPRFKEKFSLKWLCEAMSTWKKEKKTKSQGNQIKSASGTVLFSQSMRL